jgi:hypothetical protein
MQILDAEDERAPPTAGEAELAQHLERAGFDRFGGQDGDTFGALPHAVPATGLRLGQQIEQLSLITVAADECAESSLAKATQSRPKLKASARRKKKPPTRTRDRNGRNACKRDEWHSPADTCNSVADVGKTEPYGKTNGR